MNLVLSQNHYAFEDQFESDLVKETGLTIYQFKESAYQTSSDYGRCIQYKLNHYILQLCGDKPYYDLYFV